MGIERTRSGEADCDAADSRVRATDGFELVIKNDRFDLHRPVNGPHQSHVKHVRAQSCRTRHRYPSSGSATMTLHPLASIARSASAGADESVTRTSMRSIGRIRAKAVRPTLDPS